MDENTITPDESVHQAESCTPADGQQQVSPAAQEQTDRDREPVATPMPAGSLSNEQLQSAIESLLFVNERPIESKEIADIFDISKKEADSFLQELMAQYTSRGSGVCIVQVAGGYQMCSAPENESWVKKMYRERNKRKLTTPALETLAILAYKQPLTKMEIEAIRGVNADGVLKNLSDAGLVKIEGRKEVIGRPFLYITTRKFLEYFGLNTLRDLPKLEEFAQAARAGGMTDAVSEEHSDSGEPREGNHTEVHETPGADDAPRAPQTEQPTRAVDVET